jgi:predicted MFS family arabinose efflux permease
VQRASAVPLGALLCTATFLGATTWFAPVALLPFMAAGLASNVSILGQVSSVTILLAASITIIIGTLVRRYGYRRLYAAGLIALILGAASMAAAPNVAIVLLASLLLAFASAIIVPVALAIAAIELSATAQRRVMSYQIACIFAAAAIGLPACVFLAQALSWRGAFASLATLALLLLPAVFWLVPVGGCDRTTRLQVPVIIRRYRHLLGDRSLASLFGCQIIFVVGVFGTAAYLSSLLIARGVRWGRSGAGPGRCRGCVHREQCRVRRGAREGPG